MKKAVKPFCSDTIKLFAIIAMLIDHIAWAFVPFNSVAGQIMHFFGRLTAPIMCYFIAEGYFYTRNIKKYILRLGLFAIISQIPFLMIESLKGPPILITENGIWINPELLSLNLNTMFTLMLGLIALALWKTEIIEKPLRVMIVITICMLSLIGDWSVFAVLWILFFGIFHGDFKKQMISYFIIAIASVVIIFSRRFKQVLSDPFIMFWQAGLLIPPLLLYLYNGKRKNNYPFFKWFFYLFYPIHLLVIGIIKLYF